MRVFCDRTDCQWCDSDNEECVKDVVHITTVAYTPQCDDYDGYGEDDDYWNKADIAWERHKEEMMERW